MVAKVEVIQVVTGLPTEQVGLCCVCVCLCVYVFVCVCPFFIAAVLTLYCVPAFSQISAMVVATPQLLFLSQATMATKFKDLVTLLGK